jgi:hypothetical protein
VNWIAVRKGGGVGGGETLLVHVAGGRNEIAFFAFYLSSPVLDSKCVGGENLKLPKLSLTQEAHLQETNHHCSTQSKP